ncbi:MAG: conjugative transposon protein TraM [Rikenellaceae bacterium]
MSEIEKRALSPEKRKRIEQLLVYLVAGLIGIVVMWIIFAPGSDKDRSSESGFNATIPEAVQEEMATDKQSAYAKDKVKDKDAEREMIKTLAENMIEEHKSAEVATTQNTRPNYRSASATPTEKVVASTEAYRNMNKTLGSFYENPKVDTEKEKMQAELDELKEQLSQQQKISPSMSVEEQMAVVEKSYELAAKYMPGSESREAKQTQPIATKSAESTNEKAQLNNVGAAASSVVSSLGTRSTSVGFNTAVGSSHATAKNTIAAVVHSNQTITNGAAVRLRLTEEMRVGDRLLSRNSIITGVGRVQGERLQISISNVECQGYILPVEVVVIDSDGVEGIHVPNSMEVSALKSIVANMSNSASSTITIADQSAGDQILTELGTSAIDGVTQYVADKVKEVKVHLKAGHQVMLYQKAE